MKLLNITGYLHENYALSFSEIGAHRQFRRSRGWMLERPITGTDWKDAMGCYPLFVCQDWSKLHEDVRELGDELVSLALVTDPFGEYDLSDLQKCFPDVVFPFKEHFVIELQQYDVSRLDAHHRRNVRKAQSLVSVEQCSLPIQSLDDWDRLYHILRQRHHIHGIAQFSRKSFAQQLQVPGIIAFRAVYNTDVVGMLLWYVQQDIGYYHLGAYSETGYQTRASFALFSYAIERFQQMGLRWLNLGAGAGLNQNAGDGLSRFKRGWATGSRIAYFCGRILHPAAYQELVISRDKQGVNYFPAYRAGEFTT